MLDRYTPSTDIGPTNQRPALEVTKESGEEDQQSFPMPPPGLSARTERITRRIRSKPKKTADAGCDPMASRKCNRPCHHGAWDGTPKIGCEFGGNCILFNTETGLANHGGPCICAKHLWGPESQPAGWMKMILTPSLVDNETEEDRKTRCPWFGDCGAMRDLNIGYPREYRKTSLWMLFKQEEGRPPLRKPVPTTWSPTPSEALYGTLPRSDFGGAPPDHQSTGKQK